MALTSSCASMQSLCMLKIGHAPQQGRVSTLHTIAATAAAALRQTRHQMHPCEPHLKVRNDLGLLFGRFHPAVCGHIHPLHPLPAPAEPAERVSALFMINACCVCAQKFRRSNVCATALSWLKLCLHSKGDYS